MVTSEISIPKETSALLASHGNVPIRKRRGSVSSETVKKPADWVAPFHSKTECEKGRIRSVMVSQKMGILFNHLGLAESETVVSAFSKKSVKKGVALITQGDAGDFFYIVDSGKFEIAVTQAGVREVVEIAELGDSFGELALMYNAPRAATCRALEDSVVWALDGKTFRIMCVTLDNTKEKKLEMTFRNLKPFKDLPSDVISALLHLVSHRTYADGEVVNRQGEFGNMLYLVQEGAFVCKRVGEDAEEIIAEYRSGDYFGERALLMSDPWKASVYSAGQSTCLCIDKDAFNRFLVPDKHFVDVLRKKVSKHP